MAYRTREYQMTGTTAQSPAHAQQRFALEMIHACFRREDVSLNFMEADLAVTHSGEGLFPELVYNVYTHEVSGVTKVTCSLRSSTYGICSFSNGKQSFTFHCNQYGKLLLVETESGHYVSELIVATVTHFLRRIGGSLSGLVAELDRAEQSPDTDGLMNLLEAIYLREFRPEKVNGRWQLQAVPDMDDSRFILIPHEEIPQGVCALLNETAVRMAD